jgi:hypothetical protein
MWFTGEVSHPIRMLDFLQIVLRFCRVKTSGISGTTSLPLAGLWSCCPPAGIMLAVGLPNTLNGAAASDYYRDRIVVV